MTNSIILFGKVYESRVKIPNTSTNLPMVILTIFYISDPPGPPEISGYIEGETIRLGQTITLVCTAEGGNPLAEIIWYKNGIKVDYSYTTSGRASSNTYSFVASTEDNNARYRCESKNELSPTPLSAEIILSVQCKYTKITHIFSMQ